MRLVFGERLGPVREIHSGAGYWSQGSSVQVLGIPQTPDKVWIRWPGGKTTASPLSNPGSEVVIDVSGAVKSAAPAP